MVVKLGFQLVLVVFFSVDRAKDFFGPSSRELNYHGPKSIFAVLASCVLLPGRRPGANLGKTSPQLSTKKAEKTVGTFSLRYSLYVDL